MAKFIDFFNKGILAAEKAIADKAEIDSVIDQLSSDLEQATEGKIKIKIVERQEPIKSFSMTLKDLEDRKKYLAIAAYNPLIPGGLEELARWRFSESGYPCRVTLPDVEIFCEDKKSLENALARLISTPASGKIFKALMEKSPDR